MRGQIMQRNILSAAASIACAGLATQAFALSPSDLNSATTSIVRVSGSSATTNQLIAFAQNNCVSGSLAQLTTSDPSNFALLCTPDTSKISGLAHSNLVIVKNGSSVADLSALASKTGYPFLDVFNSTFKSGCGSATAVPATSEYVDPTNPGGGTRIALPGYNKYTCPLTITSAAAPDMGISDVEPALLVQAGAVPGGVSYAQLSALHDTLLNVVVYGIPVTLELRDAMQTVQIASGTLPSSCAVGDETEECMPTLSHQQIASILSGNAVDWSEFGLNNPSGDNNIYVVRRINASGTQTAARVFFLSDPCVPQVLQFLSGNDSESSTAANACSSVTPPAGTVHEGSAASDVQTCLQNHNANHRWAVGLMSVQTPAVGDANTNMRFIKIDGVSPSNLNVALGRYGFWT
jgi:ABC-type phosphate transport system substrate-binding protein